MTPAPEILRFANAARAYCEWAEGPKGSAAQEGQTALQHVARVYHFALHLPEMSSDDKAQAKSYDEWHAMYMHLESSLPFARYMGFVEPIVEPPGTATQAPLGDDLADVWRALKPGIDLFDSGLIEAAVWHWRLTFWTHWGRNASAALYALHSWKIVATDP